ncbi:distal tail protein Dit [Thermophilibacter provencensis]|uniref:Phage tail family protein n=1 Tax=Thermophilibacter provencensis TaxID=1852386 RepID=A0A921GG50_9ACTN|nr:distal tail protein Dit [Thermophilibacter provencensis]HJF44443.1 phage tail family protein [Thermophilibacter provencensis]
MSSLTYNGHDFSDYVTAELVEPAGHALSPRALMVPGRPGAALLGYELPPRVLRVRLFLDAGASMTPEERSEVRHALYGWLVAPSGAELELPGEPGLSWRDAVVTDASDWDSLFEDGSCELAFTCFDPVAYGEGRSSAAGTLTVGGTWATWPVVEMTALAGSSVKVADGLGRYVLVEREFAAGDVVLLDFRREAVTVEGEDASADVAVDSTFFSLLPGAHALTFSGCSAHTVAWTERWL